MHENGKIEFLEYLDLSFKSTQDESMKLMQEYRNDDANFIKVKGNIYQIFKTVFLGVANQKALDKEAVKELFVSKMETIPANWKKSYENARKFNDIEKITIEEIKLQTLEEIQSTFLRIWERS
ncbi:hypothetical protein [Anaerocolumna xylanovorans]|uniref:Uncharacterized protein n=1 Tax=Anaerocolumna xylanovorans DSM 12503 TaxID=1121345 RepID=A0A1M7Y173_9FIRM|nr:hypothetical protein [Anaerocolumna xylanovorans]SHO45484.1 hypothetical protein SAMN02745217_00971 [Anaerocolumna xylanovorans DSM 12503]